jgi:hypothetical protein
MRNSPLTFPAESTVSASSEADAAAPSGGVISPETPAAMPAGKVAAKRDQREHLRFNKVFPVRVESILFGESQCVARNVSAGGIFLETSDPLPLGSRVRVCFLTPDESTEIVGLGEVKNHYFLNYAQGGNARAVSGMAVRFVGFEECGQSTLNDCLDRFRVLH